MRLRDNLYWSLEKGDLLPVLLMTPAVLLIFFVMVVPLGFGLFLSFFDFRFGDFSVATDFVGLQNYLQFIRDATARRSIINTLSFSAGAITLEFIAGTIIAVLVFRMPRRAATVVRPLITIPLLISPIVVGLIWRYIYDPQGILYWFLGIFGVTIEHFPGVTAASTALLSTIIAHAWEVVPFVVIVVTAGLVSIPTELFEAAYMDGAGEFGIFWRITFPLLKDVYMVILLISGVDTIKIFDIIYSLTGGGPNNSTVSISMYAFNQAFMQSHMSYAMTLSVVAMVITFAVFGIPFIRRNRVRAQG
jgi:multiple sugar transport system permease protein